MDKLKMETMDITQENVEKIRNLFPSAVSEVIGEDGKVKLAIDFDVLKQELSSSIINDKQERYQMTWPDKKKAILLANSKVNATLRPDRAKSVDFDNTQNLYIEGDNLDVLKLLRETYLNSFKMIYIDPPYNTGNDFVYEDDFASSSDEYLSQSGQYDEQGNRMVKNLDSNGRFHTDWLNMMYPRLKVARDLLDKDGVIFISIDDNEITNLKKLCDEIYGENNFISILSVENNPKGRKNSKYISVCNDYCLIYAKNSDYSYFIENIPKNVNDLKQDEEGNFVHNSGKRVLVGEQSFNKTIKDLKSPKHYSVYYNHKLKDMVLRKEKDLADIDELLIGKGYERFVSYCENNFVENTYTDSKLKELFKEGTLDFKNGKIYEKNMSTTIRLKSLLTNKKYDAVVNGQIKKFEMDFKTTSAGTSLKELFESNEVLFSAPKNVGLLKILTTLFDSKDFSVLDFFSGSGTTAHSIMELNAEDDGNRKFVMVQIPEKLDESTEAYKKGYRTLCDLGEERIRRAGVKIKEEHPEATNLDVGFRVLKLDSSNMQDVYYNPKAMQQSLLDATVDNIKEDRTPEDLLFQVMISLGIDLSSQIAVNTIAGKTYYTVNENDIIACFDDNLTNEVITEIAKLQPVYAVFKDKSFATDSVGINNEQLFKTYSPNTTIKVL